MPGLLDSKPVRPLDPALRGNDLLAQTSLLTLVNNPNIQGADMSAADKLEQQQNAAMIAEAMGGPSQEEQAAQVRANPSLAKRKGPAKSPAPIAPADAPPVVATSAAPLPPAGIAVNTAAATSQDTQAGPSTALAAAAGVNRIFFTGRSGSGKSFLAELLNATVLEINEPLALAQDGPALSAGELERLTAWANGVYNASHINSMERIAFVRSMQTLLPGFGAPGFLVRQLITKAASLSGIVAVTNVQTVEEYNALKEAGFTPYHVAASQTTMTSRVKRQRDERLAAHLDGQASARIQKEPTGDKIPLVWSDPVTASPSARFYTPEEFVALFASAPTAEDMGIIL